MSTAFGPRHNSTPKQKVPVGRGPIGKRSAQREEEKMADIAPSAVKLFTFTIDADTAQVVKLETLDAAGARHELSEEEKASLAREGSAGGLEEFVERAFEAGIACVLGGDEPRDRVQESEEEGELRHLLLAPLIQHSTARHLVQPDALNRAILESLIQNAMRPAAPAENGPGTGAASDRAASAHAN